MNEDEARVVLGVSGTAEYADVRAAYLRRVKLLHPDVHETDSELNAEAIRAVAQLNTAYHLLETKLRLPNTTTFENVNAYPGEDDVPDGPSAAGAPRIMTTEAPPSAKTAASIWPITPTGEELLSRAREVLSNEDFVDTHSIDQLRDVEDASFATWTLSWETESRAEQDKTFPGEFESQFETPKLSIYNGPFSTTHLPVIPEAGQTLTFYQDGSRSQHACPRCEGGRCRCIICAGTGYRTCRTSVECPLCHGSGTQIITAPSGGEQTCVNCGGAGTSICPKCHGSGRARCNACAGQGWTPYGECRATGILTQITVGTVSRESETRSEPAYGPNTAAEQAHTLLPTPPETKSYGFDPDVPATDLPSEVLGAPQDLFQSQPGQIGRRLRLSVAPAATATANGADGTQTVWLIGEPADVYAPATEQHREVRKRAWRKAIGIRVALALVLGLVVLAATAPFSGILIAIIAAFVVAMVAGGVSVRMVYTQKEHYKPMPIGQPEPKNQGQARA